MSDLCCHTCRTKKLHAEIILLRCSLCPTRYCSQECQAADWPSHKQTCGRDIAVAETDRFAAPAATAAPATLWAPATLAAAAKPSSIAASPCFPSAKPISTAMAPTHPGALPTDNPFRRLRAGTYLHDRPQREVYLILIDAYCLWVEDCRKDKIPKLNSISAGAKIGLTGFRRFIRWAEALPGLLPPWWAAQRRRECEDLAMSENRGQYLGTVVKNRGIRTDHVDDQLLWQLRVLAQMVCGHGRWNMAGTQMWRVLKELENGKAPADEAEK